MNIDQSSYWHSTYCLKNKPKMGAKPIANKGTQQKKTTQTSKVTKARKKHSLCT